MRRLFRFLFTALIATVLTLWVVLMALLHGETFVGNIVLVLLAVVAWREAERLTDDL